VPVWWVTSSWTAIFAILCGRRRQERCAGKRVFGEALPVVMALSSDGVKRRRVAAWLGLLSEDLERVLSDATAGILGR